MIPHVDEIARRKLSKPPEWEICRAEWIGDNILCEGGVPRIISRGPNKGKKRWDKNNLDRVIVSEAEIELEKEQYESETGKCWRCIGKTVIIASSSITTGQTYRECPRCRATGNSPLETRI